MGRFVRFVVANAVAVTGTILSCAAPADAVMLDSNFTETLVARVGGGITSMAWAPDGSGRLFLTQKAGTVRIVEGGVVTPTPFATLSPIVTSSECGLLGLAFDPDFASNGYVYFFVTVSVTEQQIIRYTANGNVGVDRTVIVAGLPTAGRNHDGGAIGFGPDGMLYWAVGDNGSARVGVNADLTSLGAKVGRAARDGRALSDNPFYDGSGPNADHIWARGMRNPFTFTWQPSTDRLWVNVVGTRYEQVFVVNAGDHAGWNQYESNQPAGFLAPIISYPTDNIVFHNVRPNGAVRSGGVVTYTTVTPHRLRPGASVTIAGASDSSFDGTVIVETVVSPLTFSGSLPGPDGSSGGGTVTGPDIGGCITGGTFFDSTAAPATYEGNYFFGDFNSGRIERVVLHPTTNVVVSIQHWAEGLQQPTDMELGPDGDLYYVTLSGALYRARYTAQAQSLVVSRRHLRVLEGGRIALSLRLSRPITADVGVAVGWLRGDADVSVAPATVRFTSENWSIPQSVQVLAAPDEDDDDDVATLRVRSSSLVSQDVFIRVTDDDVVRAGGEGGAGGAGGTSGAAAGADVGGASGGSIDGEGGDGGGAAGAVNGGRGGEAGADTVTGGTSGGSMPSAGVGGVNGAAGDAGMPGAGSGGTNDGSDAVGDDSGCSCRATTPAAPAGAWLALISAAALFVRRLRSRR